MSEENNFDGCRQSIAQLYKQLVAATRNERFIYRAGTVNRSSGYGG